MKGDDYVGHIVEWSSQAGGNFKTKRGLVLEYIPPNSPIQSDYDCDDTYINSTSARSRLLVNVKGRLYTPVGRSNGTFPNIEVIE